MSINTHAALKNIGAPDIWIHIRYFRVEETGQARTHRQWRNTGQRKQPEETRSGVPLRERHNPLSPRRIRTRTGIGTSWFFSSEKGNKSGWSSRSQIWSQQPRSIPKKERSRKYWREFRQRWDWGSRWVAVDTCGKGAVLCWKRSTQ